MRLGACTNVHNTLTQEAASVLKHSLNLARRRGHAQVTPLHVAATLLSLRASLLKRACLKSSQQQPLNSSYPLRCRALELCFNVALNRLPTSPAPLLHGQPSLSNALVAALKRAQAHQRRGCIEQQQQQQHPQPPLLAIKVEMEQLLVSILDDPSVSRVMREAGFSSTNVKSNIEEEFSSYSSNVFHYYGGTSGGVFSSPCSPQRVFFPHSPPSDLDSVKVDVKLVLEVILGKKRKNVVVVGDCASTIEGLVGELMGRVERGEVPFELKQTQFVKFQFAPVALKLMRKEDVEINLFELRRKLDSVKETGAIVYTGDLRWAAADNDRESGEIADHLVAGIGRLVADYCGSNSRVWLMATSSYQTYMRCQMRQPPLEVQWALQAVSVPSSGLGLSLQASSIQDHKVATSKNPSQVLLESKPFITSFTLEGQDKLFTCCPECNSNYENEAQLFIYGQKKHLPPWLQPQCTTTNQKDELAEIKRKWNCLCLRQNHQTRYNFGQENMLPTLYDNNSQSLIGKSYSQASSHQWWPIQSSIFTTPNSISYKEPASMPGVPKLRRQSSCTIDFSFRNGSQKHEPDTLKLDSLRKYAEGKEENVSLSLGSSFVSGSGKSEKGTSGGFCRLLRENLAWQSPVVMSSIADVLYTEPKSDSWLLIDENDRIGKRRLALAMAEVVSGSTDSLLHFNTALKDPDDTERLAKALQNKDKVVVLVEEIGLADAKFLKFLAERFEEGKFRETSTRRDNHQNLVGQAIFILTRGDHSTSYENGVIQMFLQLDPAIGHKRKAETEIPSSKIKAPRPGKNPDPKRDLSRQSSCNTLDLNTMADDNEEEEPRKFSPNSSDLTREVGSDPPPPASYSFLDAIHHRYSFKRKEGQLREVSESFWCKFKKGFEEVIREKNLGGFSFSIEERVIEEIVDVGIGSFLNSKFDEWLKEVFQTSLRTIGHRGGEGDGGGIEVKLCFGGKSDRIMEDGFLGTYLPNKIKVSCMD